MIRILVVARSPVERAGLEALVAAGGHIAVAGGAASLGEAVTRLATAAPRVILALVESGDSVRLALPPDLAASAPAVVALGPDDAGWSLRTVRAGARAALPRTAAADTIVAAVEAAAAGLIVLPAGALDGVPRAASHLAPAPQALTAREAQILALLAEGLGNKVIAARLGISRHTVKTHVAALFQKLGVSTRAEAVAAGARMGVIML